MKAEISNSGNLAIPKRGKTELTVPGKRSVINRWLIVAVLVLLGAAAYTAYTRLHLFANAEPTAAPQTVQVAKGSVSATVSATGSVASLNTTELAFGASGRVEQVAVAVGDHVKKGQLLAKLDDTEMQNQVAQAEAQLAAAQAKLDGIRGGARPEDIASAEAAVASAQAKLSQVQKGSSQADIQAAESNVITAQNNVASAEAKLAELKKGPTAEDLTIAQTAVDQARSNLASAQARLDELKKGPTESDLATAQAAVNSAKQALTTAEDRYEMAKGDNLKDSGFSSVSAAQQNYETAKANYETAVQKLNELSAGPEAADLQDAQSAVDNAKAALASAEAKLAQVKAGQNEADIVNAEKTVDNANAALASAQAKLDQLKQGATPEDVAMAQAALTQAQAQLALKRAPYTDSDVKAAEASVQQAEVALAQAKRNLENASLLAPFDGTVSAVSISPGEMASGAVVTLVDPKQIQVSVNLAEADIARVKIGQRAQISFEALPGPQFEGKVIAIAPSAVVQSGVATYQVSLSVDGLARPQLSGLGASRGTAGPQGAQRSRQGATTDTQSNTQASPTPRYVDPKASDGTSLQDQPQDVKDLFISTYGDDAARVWAEQRSSDLAKESLKPGMTALATIYYAEKSDVLAVPNKAIKTQGRNQTVEVLSNGTTETRTVSVGLVGDQMTEIVNGLSEGEQVVIPSTTAGTSSSNVRNPGSQYIGGFPGGNNPVMIRNGR